VVLRIDILVMGNMFIPGEVLQRDLRRLLDADAELERGLSGS
jgi:hypothetical protein